MVMKPVQYTMQADLLYKYNEEHCIFMRFRIWLWQDEKDW
jgi:hypothetical protein